MLKGFFSRRRYLVSDALEDYRLDFLLRECRSKAALGSVTKALLSELGDVAAAELTITALRRYQSSRRDAGKAAATVNKELAILSAALNLAAVNEQIPAVPKFPKRLPNAAPRQGFLEEPDYQAIRRQLPEWGQPILDFGWYSGWRRSEVLGLRPEEVDLRVRQIRLHPDRSKNKEARLLPLRGFGLEAVEAAMARHGLTVFTRERGQCVSRTYWLYTWRDAAQAAGLGHFRYHDLRRSVARRLDLAGVPRKTAMAWMGHKTESMYQRYNIAVERDLMPAADKMLRYMEPRGGADNVVPFLR